VGQNFRVSGKFRRETFVNGAGSTCGHVEPFNIATNHKELQKDGVIQYSHQR